MKPKEIDRIESAIRHIQTSMDVDPWAMEIAVAAMRKQIPQKAMKSIDVYDKNLYKLYCPTCGALVANGNSRVGFMNKVSKWSDRCATCGQVIDWKAAERTDHIADSGKKVERTGKPSQDVSDSDLIFRKAAIEAIIGMIDRFERILADIRASKGDDSVCGMCEYDGAYMGQSGDWCNECPGFDKDDCFKLSDRCRKRWMGDITLPSAQPTLHGYNIEHLELIARVLQKEDLPPERVVEALTDIGRIVAIVRDEFEETLRRAVDQCMT